MKELFFKIECNDRVFKMRKNYRTEVCFYDIVDKYTTSLTFASNTCVNVRYKNIKFSGKVTKRDSWAISLDTNQIISKKNNKYFFESKTLQENNEIEFTNETSMEFDENVLGLYNSIINELNEQYDCIDDKEAFKYQLCEYLSDNYYDIQDLNQIIEHENFDNVLENEEPIIEKVAVRDAIFNECKEFCVSFKQAELDNDQKDSIITLENIVAGMPELKEIPREFLFREFNKYLYENQNKLIEADICYNVEDVLYTIGKELCDSYQYFAFINTLEAKIDEIVFDMNAEGVDQDEIIYLCKTKYHKGNIPTDLELKQTVEEIVKNCLSFDELYNKFFSIFNNDCIELKWDEEKMKQFKKYDKKEIEVDFYHSAEYEVYKYILPHYKKHLYRKNSCRYRPIIEQLPAFVSYASSVIELLFDHGLLVENGEQVTYNKNVDIDSAYKELEKL